MRSTRDWAVGLVVAFVLLCSSALGAGDEPSAQAEPDEEKYAEFVVVAPGELSGNVTYADGESVGEDVPVRLWSVGAEEFVCEILTDEGGAYLLPELQDGRYFLVVADRVLVDVRVQAESEDALEALDVVIPHGKGAFAQMDLEHRAALLGMLAAAAAEEEEEEEGGGVPVEGPAGAGVLKTVLISGAAVAIGVGVYEITEDDDDDDDDVVSP